MESSELEAVSLRLSRGLIYRLKLLQRSHEEKTGFPISMTAIIRTLLEEALKNRELK